MSVPIKSGSVYRNIVYTGDYNLRIFDDVNDNGKWDPRQFFGRKTAAGNWSILSEQTHHNKGQLG